MKTQNQKTPKLTSEQKGATPIDESKPVGYGSSIQSDGHGNRTRPQKNVGQDKSDIIKKPSV